MNKNQSMGVWLVVGILVLALISTFFTAPTTSTKVLSYTEFLNKVKNSEIKEVVIDKDAKIQLMMELFTNAGLPYQVLYEEAGFDFDHIKLIRENENDEDMDETFKLHSLPFSGTEETEDGGDPNDKGGAPKKNLSDRKSDKSQSNNTQPRTGLKNVNRTAPTKKANK